MSNKKQTSIEENKSLLPSKQFATVWKIKNSDSRNHPYAEILSDNEQLELEQKKRKTVKNPYLSFWRKPGFDKYEVKIPSTLLKIEKGEVSFNKETRRKIMEELGFSCLIDKKNFLIPSYNHYQKIEIEDGKINKEKIEEEILKQKKFRNDIDNTYFRVFDELEIYIDKKGQEIIFSNEYSIYSGFKNKISAELAYNVGASSYAKEFHYQNPKLNSLKTRINLTSGFIKHNSSSADSFGYDSMIKKIGVSSKEPESSYSSNPKKEWTDYDDFKDFVSHLVFLNTITPDFRASEVGAGIIPTETSEQAFYESKLMKDILGYNYRIAEGIFSELVGIDMDDKEVRFYSEIKEIEETTEKLRNEIKTKEREGKITFDEKEKQQAFILELDTKRKTLKSEISSYLINRLMDYDYKPKMNSVSYQEKLEKLTEKFIEISFDKEQKHPIEKIKEKIQSLIDEKLKIKKDGLKNENQDNKIKKGRNNKKHNITVDEFLSKKENEIFDIYFRDLKEFLKEDVFSNFDEYKKSRFYDRESLNFYIDRTYSDFVSSILSGISEYEGNLKESTGTALTAESKEWFDKMSFRIYYLSIVNSITQNINDSMRSFFYSDGINEEKVEKIIDINNKIIEEFNNKYIGQINSKLSSTFEKWGKEDANSYYPGACFLNFMFCNGYKYKDFENFSQFFPNYFNGAGKEFIEKWANEKGAFGMNGVQYAALHARREFTKSFFTTEETMEERIAEIFLRKNFLEHLETFLEKPLSFNNQDMNVLGSYLKIFVSKSEYGNNFPKIELERYVNFFKKAFPNMTEEELLENPKILDQGILNMDIITDKENFVVGPKGKKVTFFTPKDDEISFKDYIKIMADRTIELDEDAKFGAHEEFESLKFYFFDDEDSYDGDQYLEKNQAYELKLSVKKENLTKEDKKNKKNNLRF